MRKKLLVSSMIGALLASSSVLSLEIEESFDVSGLTWQTTEAHGGAVLTIAGPNGFEHTVEFTAGESLVFDFKSLPKLSSGTYSYSVTVAPSLTEDQRVEMQLSREFGSKAVNTGSLPDGGTFSGVFSVAKGKIVDRDAAEVVAKDQVINDDLIVTGSVCIGFDCTNGESFGFDTIRLKENNLRIKFQDTSNSGSFPSRDWQITANDSTNGGLDKFSIDDIDGGRTPFTIEANAPTNSLYVEGSGEVGFGTNEPVVEIHVVDGDTPTLRLQQDGSSGFTQQTWDLAGNEAGFFVRDVTNGSQLPFRIIPGADSESLVIGANNNVGVGGDTTPEAALHVKRTDGSAQLLVEETQAGFTTQFRIVNNGAPRFEFEDSAASQVWQLGMTGSGTGSDFLIRHQTSGNNVFDIDENGDLTITGSIFTAGGSCGSGCDKVFSESQNLPSIEEHSDQMWRLGYLPNVGPTVEGERINLSDKLGRILNELEKAHIYIDQLHGRIEALEASQAK